MRTSLIVAVAENGVIGRDGGLPWRMSSDLKLFRRLTMGKPIIMGRKTFETLKKPLDGRTNIVVTRDPNFKAEGVRVAGSVAEALSVAEQVLAQSGAGEADTPAQDEIIVIGGAQIYAETLSKADRIYLTEIQGCPDGDTKFPALEPKQWQIVSETPIEQGPKDDFPAMLKVLERHKP